jgi:hypothetical protein
MTEGAEKATWAALRNAKSAEEAAAIVTRLYERPADVAGQSAARAASAGKLFNFFGSGSGAPNGGSSSPSAPLGIGAWSSPWNSNGSMANAVPLGWTSDAWAKSQTINMSPTTNINVAGMSDPLMTALEVRGIQGRVNADALRNLQGAIQ